MSTPAFVASSSSETLTFTTNGGPADVSSGLDFVTINRSGNCPTTSAASGIDASFETPVQSAGGYTYNPVVTGASFSGGAGITANNSGWGFTPAPDGNQVAFLQGTGATITLNLSGLTSGASYNVNFWIAQRTGQVNPVTVSVNGAALGTYTPASNTFVPISMPAFVASSSTATLTFTSTGGSGGDVSAGLDSISITRGP